MRITQPGKFLDELYFCEDCYELRCTDCVTAEVSTCYCPQCYVEVPNSSVDAHQGNCPRNCLRCPECMQILAIRGTDRSLPGTSLTSPESSQPSSPYYYACSACLWDSKHIQIVAEKPSDLPSKYLAMNEARSSQRTFDDLAQHLAKYSSIPTTSSSQPKSVPRVLADLPSLPTRYWQGTKRTMPPVERPDHLPAYTMQPNRMQSKQISREARRASRLAQQTTLNGIDAVSNRQQRSKMPLSEPYEANALRPHRVRLVAKISKKCPECQRWLICPELRVSSSRFRLRRLAKNYLPQIQFTHSDSHDKWLLAISNPLQDPVDICLRSHHAEFSVDHLHLQGAPEYRDFATDSAQSDVSSQSCAQVKMHRYTDPDTPTLLQVDWNVAHRQQTLWIWVSSAVEIE